MKQLGVIGVILGAVCCSAAGMACTKPIKMAIEQWPPYAYTDGKGQAAGVDIEILKAVFAEARCTLQIGPELPRKRRQVMFMEGQIDLMLAASETPERREFSWFTAPYRDESVSLFTLIANAEKYYSLDGFAPILNRKISVLIPNAGWYGEDYKKHYFWLNEARLLSPFESFSQGMRMLGAGRAQLLLGDTGAIYYEAKQQGIAVTALPTQITSEPVRFMLSKKSVTEADTEALSAALARLEKRGVLKKIRQHYGLSLTPASSPAPNVTTSQLAPHGRT